MSGKNIHAPERQPGESFKDYKARRKASQAAAQRLIDGTNALNVEQWRVLAGGGGLSSRARHRQRVSMRKTIVFTIKVAKLRKRKPAKAHGPTWPRSDDQKAQSRPLIVIKPVRALKKSSAFVRRASGHVLACFGAWSKPMLDTAVLLRG